MLMQAAVSQVCLYPLHDCASHKHKTNHYSLTSTFTVYKKMISWVDGENKKKNRTKLMFTFEYHHYFQLRKDDKMIMMRKCWTIIQ